MAEPTPSSTRAEAARPRLGRIIAATLGLSIATGGMMSACGPSVDSPFHDGPTGGAGGSVGGVTTSTSTGVGGGGVGGIGGSGVAGGGAGGEGGAPPGRARVLTQHNDNARTGANLEETTLTTSNVNVRQFGLLFRRPVDGQIYAQPLYLPSVAIPGKGTHNVVYVATMNNSVYAFDADDPSAGEPLWHVSFVDPGSGVTPVDHTDVGWACGVYNDISGAIGILSTPVIDEASGTMYVVAKTKEGADEQVYRLHALDTTTGAERPGSPVVIEATIAGSGDGGDGLNVPFDPVIENQRSALTLANGSVYIAFASYCDTGPYHGWILGYNATTLEQRVVFNDTPDGWGGGIWMSGQGLSVDDAGNLYVLTGNGTFDNVRNFGSSFLKLTPDLEILDWFTPYNVDDLNDADLDLGSAGALLLPRTAITVGGGKGGYVYTLDRGALGQFNPGGDTQIVQSFPVTDEHVHGSPIVWDLPSGQMIYVWGESDHLRAYRYSGAQFDFVGQSELAAPPGMPGGMLSLSANGTTPGSGIVWAARPLNGNANQAVRPGILQAFDASDMTKILWDSQEDRARDDFGNFAKFSSPTVADGKVFLATFSNQLVVYGLSSFSGPCYNGAQDNGETGIDCGGTCAPCAPQTVVCPGAPAAHLGEVYTCDLGAVRALTGIGISVGCNDGETAQFTVSFDGGAPSVLDAACNTSFALTGVTARRARLEMTGGGGLDDNISFECCGSTGWSLSY